MYYNTCKEQENKSQRRTNKMLVSEIKLENGFKVVKSSNAKKRVYCIVIIQMVHYLKRLFVLIMM